MINHSGHREPGGEANRHSGFRVANGAQWNLVGRHGAGSHIQPLQEEAGILRDILEIADCGL
jgi:hypothetical protein